MRQNTDHARVHLTVLQARERRRVKFEPSKIQSYREVVGALELATTDFPTLTETTGECGVEWSMERAWRSAGGDVGIVSRNEADV